MLNNNTLINKLFIFLLLFITNAINYGQEKTPEEQNIIDLANGFFQKEKYDKALPYYAGLLKEYSKDPEYNYCYGVCLLETGNALKSIDYLRYAATKEVPVQVYFYLGKAYHLDYQFSKAINYYKRFDFNTDQKLRGKYQTDRLINMCYNAIYLMKYVPEIEVVEKNEVNSKDFYKYYDLTNVSGKIIEKPTKLKSVEEIDQNIKSIMYIPNLIDLGDVVYFSKYVEGKGNDIFRIEKIAENKWNEPENLGDIINSAYDEDFAFPGPDGNSLYFCSKGHYSMGGYDIYRSYFNRQTQTWTPPENLDFPINSPYDDMMLITDNFNSFASFSSNREGNIHIYKIKLSNKSELLEIEDYNIIKDMALLYVKDNRPGTKQEEGVDDILTDNSTQINNQIIEEFEYRYTFILKKALDYQLKVDSLNNILNSLKKSLIDNLPQEEKNKIRKDITAINEEKVEYEKLAAEKFTEVKKLEDEFITKNIHFYIDDKKIRKVQDNKFLELTEIKGLLGLKTVKKIIDLNENILDNLLVINEVEGNQSQVYEMKKLLKETKSSKEERKINKNIAKLEKEMYSVRHKAYGNIHESFIEKYQLYTEKLPEARKFQDNDLIIEIADDYIKQAELARDGSVNIYQKIEGYESENYIIKRLKEADSLDFSSIDLLEQALLLYFNYEIGVPEEEKPIEYTAQAEIKQVEDTIQKEAVIIVPEPPEVADKEITPDTLSEALKVYGDVELENIENLEKTVENNISLHVYKEFEMFEKSPYSEKYPFPVDPKLPGGIVYRVQLAVYSNSMPFDYFKGMAPIVIENTANGYLKYFAGNFKRYKSAENALRIIKGQGFNDAFIVAYQDGVKISTEKGKGLESKEAPVIDPKVPDSVKQEQVKEKDSTTVKNEIVIKIQVGAFKGEMPVDILENYKKLAPGKIFEQYVNENGIRIYTIGNFYNFEEAQELKIYIQEHGNDGIFLIALKNGKKIPIAEAKRLLLNNN